MEGESLGIARTGTVSNFLKIKIPMPITRQESHPPPIGKGLPLNIVGPGRKSQISLTAAIEIDKAPVCRRRKRTPNPET